MGVGGDENRQVGWEESLGSLECCLGGLDLYVLGNREPGKSLSRVGSDQTCAVES